jgi:hypothetical protein
MHSACVDARYGYPHPPANHVMGVILGRRCSVHSSAPARMRSAYVRRRSLKRSSPMWYASVSEVALQDLSASPLTRPLEVTTAHATQGKEPASEPHSRTSTGNTANGTAAGKPRSRMPCLRRKYRNMPSNRTRA